MFQKNDGLKSSDDQRYSLNNCVTNLCLFISNLTCLDFFFCIRKIMAQLHFICTFFSETGLDAKNVSFPIFACGSSLIFRR
jgi:hypothetical protein